jgi:hypothetical protein
MGWRGGREGVVLALLSERGGNDEKHAPVVDDVDRCAQGCGVRAGVEASEEKESRSVEMSEGGRAGTEER